MARKRTTAVSIKDVARHVGVSASTVSRVLNDHPDVSDSMRERVVAAASELGYQPDFLAQSLRGGQSRSVGFVVRDLSNPIFATLVKGAETTLRDAGYATILTNSEGEADLDFRNLAVLQQRRVDGVMLSLQSESDERLRELLAASDLPTLLLDRELKGVRASTVLCDHRTGVAEAVEHLIRLGHRRITLLIGPRGVRATRERMSGYYDAFGRNGLQVDEESVRLGSYSRGFGYSEAIRAMTSTERPTAIVSGGIQLTEGILTAARQLGLVLGADYSLVSCDETLLMEFVEPSISVVRRDTGLMGRLGAELLLGMLQSDGDQRSVTIPTEYVARGSSAPPPPQ